MLKGVSLKLLFLLTSALGACVPATNSTQGTSAMTAAAQFDQTAHDRAQIVALAAQFADAVNRHDWDAMASLHTEDAVWEGAAGELSFRNQGRAAIAAWLHGNVPKLEVVYYLCSPPHIELIAADRARSRLSMWELLRIRSSGELKHIYGIYSDELVKRDGRWLFARRSVTVKHQESQSSQGGQLEGTAR